MATPPPAPHLIARAKRLLDDGCSYAEAERTVGVSRKTLARRFPGMGMPKGTWWPNQLRTIR